MHFCCLWADCDVRVALKTASGFLAKIVEKILFFNLIFPGQCKRDRFTVRPSVGINVPTLCGINTGQHSKYNKTSTHFYHETTLYEVKTNKKIQTKSVYNPQHL